MTRKILALSVALSVALAAGIGAQTSPAPAVDPAVQTQIDAIKGVLPKFAIPMREVGDRFQNMFFAAKGGNWGLAAYMSKYMNGAMNPATLTKPAEYPMWKSFYTSTFAPVNAAIQAQDFKTFSVAYDKVITSCNGCHAAMGYGFIKVAKLSAPADQGIDYTVESKATDVPK
jgi:hypothetical protein